MNQMLFCLLYSGILPCVPSIVAQTQRKTFPFHLVGWLWGLQIHSSENYVLIMAEFTRTEQRTPRAEAITSSFCAELVSVCHLCGNLGRIPAWPLDRSHILYISTSDRKRHTFWQAPYCCLYTELQKSIGLEFHVIRIEGTIQSDCVG